MDLPRWTAVLCATAGVAAACPGTASAAATFTAACSGGTGDATSLIVAIDDADGVIGPSTVELGHGCTYTLTTVHNNWYGPNGLPAILSQVTIEGNGATITRSASAPPFRLFFVGADPTSLSTPSYVSPGIGVLTLRNVTLSGGLAKGGDSNGGGGGAGMGGAIFSQGTVVVDNSTLTGNTAQGGSADNPAAGLGGGGIGSDSPLLGGAAWSGGGFGGAFNGTSFGGGAGGTANSGGGGGGAGFRVGENGVNAAVTPPYAAPGGGQRTGLGGNGGSGGAGGDGSGGGGTGVGDPGGAFGAGGTRGGGGGGGGGGVGGGGAASAENAAGDSGGGGGFGGGGGGGGPSGFGGSGGFGGGGADGAAGVGAPGFGGGQSTTVAGGGGAGLGGAIFNMQGTLTINNSTVAVNSAIGGVDTVPDHGKGIGGAVFNMNGSFTATDSTFAGNTGAFYASQIYNLVYDGAVSRTAQTTLRNTIVAGGNGPNDLASEKTPYNLPAELGNSNADVSHFDLVQTTFAQEQGTITGSPLRADPLLGPLKNNGGLTQTMAPAAGSPVIDAGSAFGLSTDQRGQPRPSDFPTIHNSGDGSDIGAVELQCSPCTGPAQAPVLSNVSQTARRWLAGKKLATISRKRKLPVGTTFSFSLDQGAAVRFAFTRKASGRRVSGKCVPQSRRNRRKPRCRRTVTVGTLSFTGHAGVNKVRFQGRITRAKKLRPGRYILVITATGSSGRRSAPRSLAFTVVKH